MLQYSSALRTILNGATSKQNWADLLGTALGSARKLVGYYETTPSSDPVTNGTKFLDADLTGGLTVSVGNVIGLGNVANVTTHTPIDFTAVSAVLRIEGNGHSIQGTAGLTGSSADFKFTGSSLDTSGIGFLGLQLLAPHQLPSGRGPYAPALDVDAPYSAELENWSNPSSPVLVGTLVFNDPKEPLIFEDEDLALECGDIRVTQSTQSIIHGNFEFGATLLSMSQAVNKEADRPLHQVLIGCKPYNTSWTSYPASDTFTASEVTATPTPFKIRLKRQNGTVLHVFEMVDGLPINSPQLSQVRNGSVALRPQFNCAMLLPWQSHEPKLSSKFNDYFPAMRDESLRVTTAKQHNTVTPTIPVLNGSQIKGFNQYYAMQKFPLPADPSYQTQYPNLDDYCYTMITVGTGSTSDGTAYSGWATGWSYEPGSISGHDWYSGPGGPRFDRAVFPSPLVLYRSNPNGIYATDNSTYHERLQHWMLAYFNHSCHYLTDVKKLTTLPIQEVFDGKWVYTDTYYSGRGTYFSNVGGPDRHISMCSYKNGRVNDKNGNPFWMGWCTDHHHAYAQPGIFGLMFNSPMMVVASKFRTQSTLLAQLQEVDPTKTGWFMTRVMAWRWNAWAIAWKVASKHADLGISRAAIEKRWEQDMKVIYETYYLPYMDPLNTTMDIKCLRAYGQMRSSTTSKSVLDDAKYVWTTHHTGLVFYMASVLLLMKNTGSLEAMQNRSPMCNTVINFIVELLDRFSIDFILATDGVFETNPNTSQGVPISKESALTNAPMDEPISWYSWRQNIYPVSKTGLMDLVTDAAGAVRQQDVSMHWKGQYVFLRRDWLTEFTTSQEQLDKINAACAKYEGYYQKITDLVDSTTTAGTWGTVSRAKGVKDWTYRYPSAGWFKAPNT
jgi:hypothetical protein